MDPDGDGMDQQGRPMESQLTDAERMQAEQDQQDRITSLRSTLNNQDSAFGSGSMGNPLARLGGIGAGLGISLAMRTVVLLVCSWWCYVQERRKL